MGWSTRQLKKSRRPLPNKRSCYLARIRAATEASAVAAGVVIAAKAKQVIAQGDEDMCFDLLTQMPPRRRPG